MKILTVFGTRPEAIKMAPIIKALENNNAFENTICITSQHKEMLKQVIDLFEIKPDFDLNIMKEGQDLYDVTINVLDTLKKAIKKIDPDIILVQGDTTTTFASALAAFYSHIKVAHIEAGLRTFQKLSPFPEELNRQFVSRIADLHFSPTDNAKFNLIRENIPENAIHVTGNTAIDALYSVIEKIDNLSFDQKSILLNKYSIGKISHQFFSMLENTMRKIILVTGHRRENFGEPFENICNALREIAQRDDVLIIYPLHLNPNVKNPAKNILENCNNIYLLEPLDYLSFVYLMSKSFIIITDSGGIQEEAPSLGKPVLVTREVTERPEAVDAGTVKLVGTNKQKISSSVCKLLDNKNEYDKMAFAHNPYGDGKAASRIMEILKNYMT